MAKVYAATVRDGRIVFSDEGLRETKTELALKSGLCEDACMRALEERCTCYCMGRNHGIKTVRQEEEIEA